jgi:hypothetical protein
MAEYLPGWIPGSAITRQASSAIVGGQLVVVSGSGTVAPGTVATHAWVGVAGVDAAVGDQVLVFCQGIHRLVATGAITAGQNVEPAPAGTVAPHTNGANDVNIVGVALTTVAGGGVVEVMFDR